MPAGQPGELGRLLEVLPVGVRRQRLRRQPPHDAPSSTTARVDGQQRAQQVDGALVDAERACCPTRRGRTRRRRWDCAPRWPPRAPSRGRRAVASGGEGGASAERPQSTARDALGALHPQPRAVGGVEREHAGSRRGSGTPRRRRFGGALPGRPRTTTGPRRPAGRRAPRGHCGASRRAANRGGGYSRDSGQRGVDQPLHRCPVVGVDAAAAQPGLEPVGRVRGHRRHVGGERRPRAAARPGRRRPWWRAGSCWCRRPGRARRGPRRRTARRVAVRTFSRASEPGTWPTLTETVPPGVRRLRTTSKNSRVVR